MYNVNNTTIVKIMMVGRTYIKRRHFFTNLHKIKTTQSSNIKSSMSRPNGLIQLTSFQMETQNLATLITDFRNWLTNRVNDNSENLP